MHSCIFEGSDLGVRLKSTRGRGGVVEKLWFENIDMADITGEAIQMTTAYRAWMGTTEGKAPVFRDLVFRNIHVDGARCAANLEGLPEALLQGLRMEDITIKAHEGFKAKLVDGLELDRVAVHAQNGPTLEWNQCSELEINGEAQPESGRR